MLKPNSVAFTVLLAGLAAMAPISTDIALPAYGATAEALGTTQAAVAVSLSLFMIGYALGPLLHGPLSERFGRRPVLVAGLLVYLASSAICALTPTLSVLLAGRLVQGFAASSASVLALAIVRDLYEGMEARRKLSYVMLILGLMPMIAPTLGAIILVSFGWRSVYVAMAGAGLVLLAAVIFGFAESIRARNPNALAPRHLLASYGEVLRHPTGFGFSALGALCFGVMFSFISGSSMLFMDVLGVSAATYGYLFAIPVLGMMAGTMANSRLVGRGVSDGRTMAAGFAIMLAAVALLLVVSLTGMLSVWLVVALLIASNFGTGLILPNSSHRALQPMPHLAGFASAVLNSAQMAVGAISSAIVAALVPWLGGSAMVISMAGFAVAACGLFVVLSRIEPEPARAAG
ncbi:multidrug effflux MFS transporter [Kaistia nematophila]|uniref:Bcr/CflA family efflux transporter n=1 Tax=Kaistia nematophila TaxID=2994654 RepID=A0A9X3E3J5_9HYPH|nr:multidrug effflux MFS transporter [Kaistia nematophila]MCX5570839.1 multidrug effflux MFS transporter [Kaistia nematophila]